MTFLSFSTAGKKTGFQIIRAAQIAKLDNLYRTHEQRGVTQQPHSHRKLILPHGYTSYDLSTYGWVTYLNDLTRAKVD